MTTTSTSSPAPAPVTTQAGLPATSASTQDVEAFGELGPVLIFTFVLWLAIMVAVGVSV